MVELDRMVWENVKTAAEEQVRQSKLSLINAEMMLERAIKEIKLCPIKTISKEEQKNIESVKSCANKDGK